MNLRIKLIGGVFTLLFASLIYTFIGFNWSSDVSNSTKRIQQITFPSLDQAIMLQQIVEHTQKSLVSAVEEEDEGYLEALEIYRYEFVTIVGKLLKTQNDSTLNHLLNSYLKYSNNGGNLVNMYLKIDKDIKPSELASIKKSSKSLIAKIENFRDKTYKEFNESIINIYGQTHSFSKSFLWAGAILFLFVLYFIFLTISLKKGTSKKLT